MEPCTISLDGCSALQALEVFDTTGLVLTASRPLPHLATMSLGEIRDLVVPWQHIRGVRELWLTFQTEAGSLEGATHLTSLKSLVLDCSASSVLPPGAWLAGVTHMELDDFDDAQVGGVAGGGACILHESTMQTARASNMVAEKMPGTVQLFTAVR